MSIKDLTDMIGKGSRKKQRAKDAKIMAAGIGAAAVAGVAAGILLAPKAGKETREDIKNKAAEVVDTTKEVVQDKAEHVKEAAVHVAEEIGDVIKEAKNKRSAKAAFKKEVNEEVAEVEKKIEDAAKVIIDAEK